MKTVASTARSISASSNTITGFLPPSSKCTRFRVFAPWAMIMLPVRLSPTKPIARMRGCSVSALPASSPKPFTRFHTPLGSPASSAISTKSRADRGENSAGLCTTVQPAAKAGAIFQVDSIKGVFHGVMIPTGPKGAREVRLTCPGAWSVRPSRASTALSAKKRKFSAPRSAALDIKRSAWPVSMLSTMEISSARASIPSAIRCKILRRSAPGSAAHAPKAACAARAAASTSAASPRATCASGFRSTGEMISNVLPLAAGTAWPPIWCSTPSLAKRARNAVARVILSSSFVIWSSGAGEWHWFSS